MNTVSRLLTETVLWSVAILWYAYVAALAVVVFWKTLEWGFKTK